MERMDVLFSPPDITELEIEAVAEALRSGWITTGPKTKEFEKVIAEYVGTERAVCLNSATACLEMTLRLLGIGPGDEVIVPAYTYTASASVINHVGADIVMIDSRENTFEMDYDKVADAITEKTKAVIPVDFGGRMCNYEEVFRAVNSRKAIFRPNTKLQECIGRVAVVADSAHGFGARSKLGRSGEIADFTCFSFHAVKNLTTAEGGAVTWRNIDGIDNDDIYQELMLASLHGQSKDALAKTQIGAWEYDIVYPAYKCNMTDIAAALGLTQFQRYPELLAKRREIIEKYNEAFIPMGLRPMIHYDEEGESSGHLYALRIPRIGVEERNEIIVKMSEAGISCNVHYKPLPMMTAYKNLGFDIKDYPNAYALYAGEITLPLHTKLTDEDVEYVIGNFKEVVNKYI